MGQLWRPLPTGWQPCGRWRCECQKLFANPAAHKPFCAVYLRAHRPGGAS